MYNLGVVTFISFSATTSSPNGAGGEWARAKHDTLYVDSGCRQVYGPKPANSKRQTVGSCAGRTYCCSTYATEMKEDTEASHQEREGGGQTRRGRHWGSRNSGGPLTLALGMRPRGPSTLAALPTMDIISGVATHRSKSMFPGVGHGRCAEKVTT